MNINYEYDLILRIYCITALISNDYSTVGIDGEYNKVEMILIRRTK